MLSGEWSEEGGGAGNSTSGGRTSQEDWLEGGRQKRERVVASSTRVCSVEHDHRHKDGLEVVKIVVGSMESVAVL